MLVITLETLSESSFIACFISFRKVIWFTPQFIILKKNCLNCGTKSWNFNEHLAIVKNSDVIEPYKSYAGVLTCRSGIWTIENGWLSLLTQSLYLQKPSKKVTSRSRKVACHLWCSHFKCHSYGKIHQKNSYCIYHQWNVINSYLGQFLSHKDTNWETSKLTS